jgi:hypothetical protein
MISFPPGTVRRRHAGRRKRARTHRMGTSVPTFGVLARLKRLDARKRVSAVTAVRERSRRCGRSRTIQRAESRQSPRHSRRRWQCNGASDLRHCPKHDLPNPSSCRVGQLWHSAGHRSAPVGILMLEQERRFGQLRGAPSQESLGRYSPSPARSAWRWPAGA